MVILLLGSNGYVGTEFKRQLDSYVTLRYTDIVDENFLREFIRDNGIEFVINCAGYVGNPNVDACDLYIWRLRMPFESVPHKKNLITKLPNYTTVVKAKNSISRLSDFVRCCIESYEKRIPFGIYNVTNGGHVYFPDLCRSIDNSIKRKYVTVDEISEMFVVPRSNCILSNSKLLDTGIEMDDVHTAIEKCGRN
jgi:dTDP-4-dehydrorhamnose reductase